MARNDQGVRIGPISLFTLVAALGMAVLAVLTISTSKAMNAISMRTATMASEAYQAEACAQALVGSIDETLADTRAKKGDRAGAVRALTASIEGLATEAAERAGIVEDGSPAITATAKLDGNTVVASFDTYSGRRLDVRISITSNVTYTIDEWKATSQAGSVTADVNLWTGTSS